MKRKKVILTLTTITILTSVLIGLSYGYFVVNTSNYKASELLVSNLLYGIQIEESEPKVSTIENNKITIPANTTSYYDVTLSSVNKIDSKYTLAYKTTGNVEVKYTDKTSWSSIGVIEGYKETTYTKRVRIRIENKGEETTVELRVYGGYTFNTYESIALSEGYVTVSGPYKEAEEIKGSRLVDIIESETGCITEERCMYEGGRINNYIQYPESSNKSENLWRIIGSYKDGSNVVSKIIREKDKPK